jgi:hypothetical protein
LLAIYGVFLTAPAAGSPDVWAIGSAEWSADPGYENHWKYCYEIYWAGLPHGVSHVDVLLCLIEDCECLCESDYFVFAETVGSGPGTSNGEPCTVYYYGYFECFGDPSIEIFVPVIKFEPYEGDCEPGIDGWAYLCFYSVGAPMWGTFPNYIAIKFGTEFALGDLEGALPGCNTAWSSTESSTWGRVKALYR